MDSNTTVVANADIFIDGKSDLNSVDPLFALNTDISIKYGYNKKITRHSLYWNEIGQRFKVEESTGHKCAEVKMTIK